jgi:hypothetical protein
VNEIDVTQSFSIDISSIGLVLGTKTSSFINKFMNFTLEDSISDSLRNIEGKDLSLTKRNFKPTKQKKEPRIKKNILASFDVSKIDLDSDCITDEEFALFIKTSIIKIIDSGLSFEDLIKVQPSCFNAENLPMLANSENQRFFYLNKEETIMIPIHKGVNEPAILPMIVIIPSFENLPIEILQEGGYRFEIPSLKRIRESIT